MFDLTPVKELTPQVRELNAEVRHLRADVLILTETIKELIALYRETQSYRPADLLQETTNRANRALRRSVRLNGKDTELYFED